LSEAGSPEKKQKLNKVIRRIPDHPSKSKFFWLLFSPASTVPAHHKKGALLSLIARLSIK
jgi:hypothetical protein